MRSADPLRERYDETPYRDQGFPKFDLRRLLGMARLFGLGPDPSTREDLRVLDLGCASGRHIREQAQRYAGASFTGVDFSERELQAGQQAIREAGLDNCELVCGDLRTIELDHGAYDLVVSHGIFSWVPDDVKGSILRLACEALKPGGIVAIAYVTYPGWKQREAFRELLSFQVRDVTDPDERLRQAALLLRLLHSGFASHPENPEAQSLQRLVEAMQRSSRNAFLHDELGREHDPCYFIQFVEWARECGLQYVAESSLETMALDHLPAESKALLAQLSPDFIETQQIIDFLVNRSGRSSLLCRKDAKPSRSLSAEKLGELFFGSELIPTEEVDLETDAPSIYKTFQERTITVSDKALKRVLANLAEAFPMSLPLDAAIDGCTRIDIEQKLLGLIGLGGVEVVLGPL